MKQNSSALARQAAVVPLARRFRESGRNCLRLCQIETALDRIGGDDALLAALGNAPPTEWSCGVVVQRSEAEAYRFEGIPDYERRTLWPGVPTRGHGRRGGPWEEGNAMRGGACHEGRGMA